MRHRRHDPVQRVNDRHADDLLVVARTLGGHPEATSATAERIDAQGLDLVLATPAGPVTARVLFGEPVSDPRWMRAAFRDLTRRAQAALAAERRGSDTS